MKSENKGKIAVIMIRGMHNLNRGIKDTLQMLRLHRKHCCSVIDDTQSTRGMLKKVKDYVTYGDLQFDTFKLLVSKRGEEYKGPIKDRKGKISYNRFFEFENKKYRPYFRLSPPKGGFEKKGIKVSFSEGGVLGNRKEAINELIKRMI